MNAFVTVDSNWGISYKDSPLVTIPSEKKERLKALVRLRFTGLNILKSFRGIFPSEEASI